MAIDVNHVRMSLRNFRRYRINDWSVALRAIRIPLSESSVEERELSLREAGSIRQIIRNLRATGSENPHRRNRTLKQRKNQRMNPNPPDLKRKLMILRLRDPSGLRRQESG